MKVVVKGVRNTLDTLKDLDNDVRKQVMKGLRKNANELRDEARGLVKGGQPLSGWKGWRGGYDSGAIQSGIKVTAAKRRKRNAKTVNVIGVENTTAAGVIWEVAGRKTSGKPPQFGVNPKTGWSYGNGVGFIQAIRRKSGVTASRLVWDAYDSPQAFDKSKARDDIIELVDKATQAAQNKLGVHGG